MNPEAVRRPPTVRPVLASEWEALRDFRLLALADAPQAFGSTLAVEGQFPAEIWQRRALASDERTNFVATVGNLWAGCVCWVLQEGVGMLSGMWVAPAWRRRGVATALVQAVVERHQRSGASELRLWVSTPNLGARRCYEATGFRLTGRTKSLPSDPKIDEVEMRFEALDSEPGPSRRNALLRLPPSS